MAVNLSHRIYSNINSSQHIFIYHGLFGMSDNWHQLANKLSEYYNVITVDQRNHGKSPHTPEMSYEAMAEDVSLLMNNLSIKKACHVGHSMGGKMIMKFVDIYPEKVEKLIQGKTVFVIGSGPSLSFAIPELKKFKKSIKIAADSSLKPLIDNGIIPDIIVTDLDGDENAIKKISKKKSIFVVHAHGDNIEKLQMVKKIKNCIGTTQTEPFNKIQNFGGFTDGDRGVFLASYFDAKKIILFGMDFGTRIGKFSNTKKSDRKIKLKKLKNLILVII